MNKLQFRVLYREFLFRVIDLEVLSAHALGDATKLYGQIAALLLFISGLLAFQALMFGGAHLDPARGLLGIIVTEHFLISTTMLVVGLFAVLSWDSTFPDRRDVMVLAPLPVSARTMFLAKVAAGLIGLLITDLCLMGFRKVPFACSYLPGKSRLHVVFVGSLWLLYFVRMGLKFERQALQEHGTLMTMVVILALSALCARLASAALGSADDELRFEDAPVPAVAQLGLSRDGVMPTGNFPGRP